jgi:hypothetical protein
MTRTREQILQERRQLKAEYGELFNAVTSLLFHVDPIGIAFDNENQDEYDPEAGTILPRLKTCKSAGDALRVVHEEFVRWFGVSTAGPQEHYRTIAAEIWQLWLNREGGGRQL